MRQCGYYTDHLWIVRDAKMTRERHKEKSDGGCGRRKQYS